MKQALETNRIVTGSLFIIASIAVAFILNFASPFLVPLVIALLIRILIEPIIDYQIDYFSGTIVLSEDIDPNADLKVIYDKHQIVTFDKKTILGVRSQMDCGEKSLADISIASKDLIARVKNGTLNSSEYTGGTFAISNLGMFDVSSFIAIIQPPQTAVIAVGTVMSKPIVVEDKIVIAQMMNATLSADHRIVDGADGARFITSVKEALENPIGFLV